MLKNVIRLTTILCPPLTLECYLINCYHRRLNKTGDILGNFLSASLADSSGHKCGGGHGHGHGHSHRRGRGRGHGHGDGIFSAQLLALISKKN